MASTQIDNVLNIYKLVCKNPILTGARITNVTRTGITIQSSWSQKNLVKRSKQKFTKDITLDAELNPVVENFPVDVTTEIANCATEDEQLRAVFKQCTVDNTQKTFIELWEKTGLTKCYDLSAYDIHGEIYTDNEFSSFCWSPDKSRLMYIAEKKAAKCEPFYKQKSKEKIAKEESEREEISRGTEYVYKPHWGEQLAGKHQSVIVVLNIDEDTLKVVPFIPEEYFPGQVTWTPNGEYIVGVVWKREPRYFGLYACTNRASWLFILKNTEFRLLTIDGYAVRSPRFSPDGKNLVFYQRPLGSTHHNAHRLRRTKWETDEQTDTIIDIVTDSQIISGEKKFYGLYARNLSQRCWCVDSQHLFFSTPQRNCIKSYIVNIETKVITEIPCNDSSLIVLDVKKNRIVFLKTSLMKRSQLVVGRLDPQTSDVGNLNLINVTNLPEIPGIENLMFEHNEYEYKSTEEVKDFNFTYFGKKSGDEKSTPLIVMPHGGPHGSFANTFSVDCAVLALLGFSILQVNYRGSTGMGSKNVEYLEGKVGGVDVLDCVTATEEALKKYPWLNPDKVGISGGSHGGFLTAHLTGLHSNLYKVAVMRNPVIDIPAMLPTSDIPDWCAAVTGNPFLEKLPPTEKETKYTEIFIRMLNHSPILFADKVKAPTLICLGKNDLRVPYYQGKLWYHRLIANNVKTKMLLYDDNHSLSSDPVEMDNVINVALWFIEHTTDKEEVIPAAAPAEAPAADTSVAEVPEKKE